MRISWIMAALAGRFGILSGLAYVVLCGSVQAAIPASLADAANCTANITAPLAYVFCDDGVPAVAGGRVANFPLDSAITVPAEYGGDGYTGLPPRVTSTLVPGADLDGNVALDVDVSVPTVAPPPGGYPLLFYMHGCCSGTKTSWESDTLDPDGERWHYNNAWFASRGYFTVNYTARGFTGGSGVTGSTGEAQLISRRFEINDYQHLACQMYASAEAGFWDGVGGTTVTPRIDPQKVVVTGGSYSGGVTWMSIADPIWTCTAAEFGLPADVEMKLAAAAPRYGWTDLVYSLVPTGRHFQNPMNLPNTEGCDSGPRKSDGSVCDPGAGDPASPVGIPISSILVGLFGTGLVGTTFPPEISEAFLCLNGPYPPELNPIACLSTIDTVLPRFLRERSAYYQNDWFANILGPRAQDYRVPIFSAGTTTDPLFPPTEHRRMHNRILELVPDYPLQSYFGDYQHFVQNKAKEWADLCGADHHICKNADYPGMNLNVDPAGLARRGIHSRLNRFLDFYVQPVANPAQSAPSFDTTLALQICPKNATAEFPANEPGERFTAARFEDIADASLTLDTDNPDFSIRSANTQSTLLPSNNRGVANDPVVSGGGCHVSSGVPDAGIAYFESEPLAQAIALVGAPVLTVDFTTNDVADSLQLNARLYEVFADGESVLIDRGPRRINAEEAAAGQVTYQLHGNGWRFTPGNFIRLELTQDDFPYLKNSTPPSTVTISRVQMTMPIRTASGGGGGVGGGGGGNGAGGDTPVFSGSGGGGCVALGAGLKLDPLWPMLLLSGLVMLRVRRKV